MRGSESPLIGVVLSKVSDVMKLDGFYRYMFCCVAAYGFNVHADVLIEDLKGIVLSGAPLDAKDSMSKMQGIEFLDLELPGSPKLLEKQLSAFLDAEVTTETLLEIKQVVGQYFADCKYPFVLVQAPEQDVTSGVLSLQVTESRLGKVQVEGNEWTPSNTLTNYIQVLPGDRIDESRLIQNVSFINRNPFRRVDLVFVPGEKPGTTDLILATKDRRPVRIYGGGDNSGVQPTGEGRWYTGFNWGRTFHWDHILSYQFTSALELKKFHAHTIEYTALLSWRHVLDIYGGYSKVHPKVQAPFKRNDGWSMQASGRYVVPLKIYRYLVHEITAGGDFKRSNNTFEFTENFPMFGNNVNLTQLMLGYSGNYERNQYRIDFKGNVFWSPGQWIADQTNADYDSLRPGAVNHWVYFRGEFSYLQKLPKSFSLSLSAVGQIANEPLLPSEQFGLGGYDTVRGYEQRQVNKDDALVVSAEARSPAMPILKWAKPTAKVADALQFLVFCDYGWGINIDLIPGGQKADFLLGAGPGVRYTLEPYLTARLDWGIRLHNKEAFGGGTSMFHFNVTASY